jgi:hypothetical protein
MSLERHQIAEAFCRWKFTEVYPYFADDIKWNAVGRKEYVGREAVIARCEESTKFLETVSTIFDKLKIICAETCVIVQGAAQFRDRDNRTLSVASCDVFRFTDDRLVEITSYVIDL